VRPETVSTSFLEALQPPTVWLCSAIAADLHARLSWRRAVLPVVVGEPDVVEINNGRQRPHIFGGQHVFGAAHFAIRPMVHAPVRRASRPITPNFLRDLIETADDIGAALADASVLLQLRVVRRLLLTSFSWDSKPFRGFRLLICYSQRVLY